MKKGNYFKILLISVLSILLPIKINAASATINLTASSTRVVTGNTVKVYVNTYSSTALGVLEYTISYDSDVLKLSSISGSNYTCSSKSCTWYTTSQGTTKSTTSTLTFKAIGSGSSKVTVTSVRVVDYNEKAMTTSVSPVTVSVITQEQLEASYSKDNYLKALSIDGQTLNPKFNKDTLKYTVELDSTIEEIVVNATRNDSRAKVSGTGKIKVTEGDNEIKVIVTAENGSKRTYTIIATVKELNPINVTIDNENYMVVKKTKLLTMPQNYLEKEIVLEDQKVTAFYNDITKYTLVGLKNSGGEINLYIYDNEQGTYTLYKEYTFNGTNLRIIDAEENIPEGYIKTTIEFQGKEITAYKDHGDSEFALIYAVNLNTGKQGYYKYDLVDETIQRFDERDLTKEIDQIKQEYKVVLLALSIVLVLVLIVVIISSLISKKKQKKKKKSNKKTL